MVKAGSFSGAVFRELFRMNGKLSGLTCWTAFHIDRHDAALRHFIQALRLARAGGDVQLGPQCADHDGDAVPNAGASPPKSST
ncbi:hypothetical protein ACFPFX_23865 [Streptomyces mauvecolor]|uniref:Uncharacterized protein n=1 Tax=Streptomyces mauvecolor TaxID=58345 RepID=A0ABV9USI0_9ACTN